MRAKQKKTSEKRIVISVSDFKMRCLRLVEEVGASGHEYLITKHGKPMALVTAVPSAPRRPTRGRWKGLVESQGDIVHVDWSGEFEATRGE